MKFYTTVINKADPEVQELWNEFSNSKGALKHPFPKGSDVKVVASNIKKSNSKKWKPVSRHT